MPKTPKFLDPKDPIRGEHLIILQSLFPAQSSGNSVEQTRLADWSMILNVPPPKISALRKGPSSIEVRDYRVQKSDKSSRQDQPKRRNLNCIRPYHAILVRLFFKHPEYATCLPEKPSCREVYELIQPMLRAPGTPLNEPGSDTRKQFAPVFGRSAINSLKFLPTDPDTITNREMSPPVLRLQQLIVKRFSVIYRDTYKAYYENFKQERREAGVADDPMHAPTSKGWTILRERDSLTDWMDDDLLARFEDEVLKQWIEWWDTRYMKTVTDEAASRGLSIEDALTKGNWRNKVEVTTKEYASYKAHQKPILGDDHSPLVQLGELSLTNPEALWLMGIAPKTYFMFRERPRVRVDASVSLLLRHFRQFPDDLDLFVTTPPPGEEMLRMIQAVDPGFKRSHMGPLMGGGQAAGYNMTRPDAEVPFFARRAASLLADHLPSGDEIYWDLREAVEAEARARKLDMNTFWDNGVWQNTEVKAHETD